MKKNLSLITIVVITLGSIYTLVHFYKMESFVFAWIINFLLMALVSTFIETLKSPLTSSYYEEKVWEHRGKIYEYLGVNFFRKLLVIVGWEKVIRKANPIEKNTSALTNLYYQTKKSELGHTIILFIVFVFNVCVVFKFGVLQSLSLLILNILLNLYPIFLQRYNRPRIKRALHLSKLKQTLQQ